MYWNAKKAKIKLLSIWLTLTWDVLKSREQVVGTKVHLRLTLTWDVLKWQTWTSMHLIMASININMRCIEIE